MMTPWIVLACIVWFAVQVFVPRNQAKWSRRFARLVSAVSPWAMFVWSDLRFLGRWLRARFTKVNVDWDDVTF